MRRTSSFSQMTTFVHAFKGKPPDSINFLVRVPTSMDHTLDDYTKAAIKERKHA